MEGWTVGWLDGHWIDSLMDGGMALWMHVSLDGWFVEGSVERWIVGWMDALKLVRC